MNREIKVRAWDTQANTWVEGLTLTIHTSGRLLHIPEHIILTWSTGLTDKHGQDIYGGDIVQSHEHNFKLIVKWSVGTGLSSEAKWLLDDGYYTTELELETKKWDDTTPDCANVDVIGNIYKHPELLQVMRAESWHGYDPLTREKVEGGQP